MIRLKNFAARHERIYLELRLFKCFLQHGWKETSRRRKAYHKEAAARKLRNSGYYVSAENLNAEKAYVVIKGNDRNTVLAARNLADAKLSATNTLNVYEILKYKKLVLTKEAVKAIEEVYA